jgi:hypothetical protein
MVIGSYFIISSASKTDFMPEGIFRLRDTNSSWVVQYLPALCKGGLNV